MSRHRNLKHIEEYDDYSDYSDHDGAYDSEDDSPFFRRDPFVENEVELNRAVEEVVAVLGEEEYSEEEVRIAVRVHEYDADAAINWLLEQCDEIEDAAAYYGDSKIITKSSVSEKVTQKVSKDAPTQKPAASLPQTKSNVPSDLGRALTEEDDVESRKFTEKFLKSTQITSKQEGAFDFSTPSPDDIVFAARSGKPIPETVKKVAAVAVPSPATPVEKPKTAIATPVKATAAPRPVPDESGKKRLSLAVIGHVDAGKSTLMGHLLYKLRMVSQKDMHKYETESAKLGKASFKYAWVLDQQQEERSRGITMDVGLTNFETPSRSVTLLDTPGHRDFIPNMIAGAAQADVAILVIDASPNNFESGFGVGGQTKEHAMLARALGVQQLVIAVNKLDTSNWDPKRFNDIVEQLTAFLVKHAGFTLKNLVFVPVSGLTGENLCEVKEQKLREWYSGPTLVELIDKFEPPVRPLDLPFRLCVSDVYRSQGLGVALAGRVEAGTVVPGDKLVLMPLAQETCTVKLIERDEVSVKAGFAGENVVLGVQGIEASDIGAGTVLCPRDDLIPVVKRFQAKLVTFNPSDTMPILRGHQCVLVSHYLNEPVVIKRIVGLVNRSTGEIENPGKAVRVIPWNSTAVVEIVAARTVCVELYSRYKNLGRFTLRDGGQTIAAGFITELY